MSEPTYETEWSDDSLRLLQERLASKPVTRRKPTRAEMAAYMGRVAGATVPHAVDLAGRVREDADAVAEFFAGRTTTDLRELCVVLAAMVPDDRTSQELLRWVTFDEHGRQLPAGTEFVMATGRAPFMALRDIPECGTAKGFFRHQRLNEPADLCGCGDAYNAYQIERRARKQEASDAA